MYDLDTISSVVRSVTKRYAKVTGRTGRVASVTSEEEELVQEGWACALEALRSGTYDPTKGPLGPWLWRAVSRQLGNQVARWVSCMSLGKGHDLVADGTALKATPHYLSTRGTLYTDPHHLNLEETPEALTYDPMKTPAKPPFDRDAFLKALDRCFDGWPQSERRVIELRYGLDGDTPVIGSDLASMTGFTVGKCTSLVRRFQQKARTDLFLYTMHQKMQSQD